MRFGLHILSVLLTVALFVSGCAHNIIDVPAPSGANASDYSWKTSVASVSYTSEQKNVKTPVEIDFVQTNNTGGYDLVEHTNGIITDTLHLVSSANVLSVSGLSGRSVIGIPSGYVMTKTKFDTIASFPNITKVFAFGS
ncbi:MAG TPA: hypothetical protein VET48_11830, partial [Steroidobacteraceae bacterium]|nr:hypothetical protein [Steroidobacteraceae bacterium]